jgi:hypothetical protein
MDILLQSSRHFAFLPLTDFSRPLILRFQIRGNVEAPDGPSRVQLTVRFETHATGPGSKRKIEREVLLRAGTLSAGRKPAVRPMF